MSDPIPPALLGTWKLVSVLREEIPSGETTDLFGPEPIGVLSYGADGRMICCIVRRDRQKPAGPQIAPAEAAQLFRSHVSYAGDFEVNGNEVTHFVDVSWNERWTGTKQQRFFRFDGDRLTLSTNVSADPIDGKTSVRTLTWQRLR